MNCFAFLQILKYLSAEKLSNNILTSKSMYYENEGFI